MQKFETLQEYVSYYPVVQFFKYDHLPPHLQEHSRPFAELALKVAQATQPGTTETHKALDKLMEAKDAAVRAAFQK